MTTPIYLNARFLTQPVSGVQRYAREIIGALDRRLAADPALAAKMGPIRAFCPEGAPIAAPPGWRVIVPEPLPGGRGHFWDQTALWRASRDGVLISLCNAGPLLHRRHILTLHDANLYVIPEAFSPAYLRLHRLLRPLLAARAARLTTVSAFSAGELARFCRVAVEKFTVIPNAADHLEGVVPEPAALARHGLTEGGYLLAVGNQSPNKNIARLVAAHAACGPDVPPLAVAGGFTQGVARDALQATDRVHVLGRVSDGELKALFAGAAGFVWPSLYEGFGIPPLEAMRLGTPVLSSDSSAMPEVLGGAARYMPALSVSAMTAALEAFAQTSPEARAKWVARGRARAAEFTWTAAAERLGALAEELRAPTPPVRSGAPASAGTAARPLQKDPRLRPG